MADRRARTGPIQPLTYTSPRRLLNNLGLFVFGVDLVVLAATGALALYLRFGGTVVVVAGEWRDSNLGGLPYWTVAAVLVLLWLGMIWVCGAYQVRLIGNGTDEFKAVTLATMLTGGLVSIVCYLGRLEISRGFLALAFPLGLLLLMAGRLAARAYIRYWRRRGRLNHRVLLVGTPAGIDAVAHVLALDEAVGFRVVARCEVDPAVDVPETELEGDGVPATPTDLLRAAGLAGVEAQLRDSDADTVIVGALGPGAARRLRLLAWALEGTGLDLVVAPTLTEVAGPRIHVRPASGVPLLHVEEPSFAGASRVAKTLLDRVGAAVLLLALSPLYLVLVVLVRASSPGPALFRQRRVGLHGEEFTCYKFRTMVVGAERQRRAVDDLNCTDGVLFKAADDPRVTRVGRVLRRHSIDELPQLLNVLAGRMSLVGPRPPLPEEVARYGQDMRRRLMVKPGMTGLWQVSGRSNLSWADSVRLDLYYVENWSLSGDLVILLRTFAAVVKGTGAY